MIRLDETLPPLLIVKLEGKLTMDDVAVQRDSYQRRHERAEAFGLIVDSRAVELPTAEIRSALANLSNDFGDATKRDCIGVAVVVDSKLAVGALTAIKWFIRSPVDLTYHTSAALALAHLIELGQSRGVRFPAACQAQVRDVDNAVSAAKQPR